MQPSFNIANLTNSVVIIHCHHWTCETTLKYCWQEFEHIYLLKSVMGKLNIKLISLWNGRKRLTQASQEHTDCAHVNHKLLLPKLRTQAGCRNSRCRNRASQTWFGTVISEFLKNVVGRVPWAELDRAGWAGLVQNSPNDEHKEALVLLAASEDLINCVIVVVTNFIIDIIEDVDEVVYPTKDTFHWETTFK